MGSNITFRISCSRTLRLLPCPCLSSLLLAPAAISRWHLASRALSTVKARCFFDPGSAHCHVAVLSRNPQGRSIGQLHLGGQSTAAPNRCPRLTRPRLHPAVPDPQSARLWITSPRRHLSINENLQNTRRLQLSEAVLLSRCLTADLTVPRLSTTRHRVRKSDSLSDSD